MVYRTVKHRGQWPKSSSPLVMSRSRFLTSHLSWQAQASASVGQATPANARPLLRNCACPGNPAGPATGVRTVWSLVWAAPCLDHSEPQFLSSLLWNGESLGHNRVVSSTQCTGLRKDTRYYGCPTGKKPAKEIEGSRSWEWQAAPGPY